MYACHVFALDEKESIEKSVTRTSNNVRHVCDFRYASNFLRLFSILFDLDERYVRVSACLFSLNAALPKAS